MRVAAHGWKNLKLDQYNPKSTGTLILLLSINYITVPVKAFYKPVIMKTISKCEADYPSLLLTWCRHTYSLRTQYVVHIITLYWYI